ncbi:hypothetical protein ACQP2U_43380 (plasmid) [Nocardia sp. CA-084685]
MIALLLTISVVLTVVGLVIVIATYIASAGRHPQARPALIRVSTQRPRRR